MKWSRYNILFISSKGEYLLYNALSNSFVEVDKEMYYLLQKYSYKQEIFEDDLPPNFDFSYAELKKMKVFVVDDNHELLNLKFLRRRMRFENRHLVLTINPTLDCNFKCDYCFEEEKERGCMSVETCDKLIEFIRRFHDLKKIDVTWFGGEPLLYPKVIDVLSAKIKDLDIDYEADIITNGYLLTIPVIEKLSEWKVKFVQITIDGLPEVHNQRRVLKSGEGTFDKIIANIDNLLAMTDIYVSIRVNIDKRNEDGFVDIFRYLRNRFQLAVADNRLGIYPGFVESVPICMSAVDCVFSREKKKDFLLDKYDNDGLLLMPFYPSMIDMECAVRNINSFVIGPCGEVYKCWNDVGQKDRIVADIVQGKVVNEDLLLDYLAGQDPLDSEKCQECFLFPVCTGGCPYVRLKAAEDPSLLEDCCILQKGDLQLFLEKHYEFKKRMEAQDEKA